MRFKGLDLNLLVAAHALLSEKSVTRAAERLCLSQSATSCALARLREAVGDDLLVQSGKLMVATPFGEAFLEQVQDVLSRVDSTMHSNRNFEPQHSCRHFRIASSDFVAEVVLEKAQREISRVAPDLSLDLLPLVSDAVFAEMKRGDIDLVIVPVGYSDAGNTQALLFRDAFVCIADRENDSVGPTIGLDQYRDMDHVILKPFGRTSAVDELFLARKGVTRRIKVTAPVFSLIPRFVAGTHRIATIPSRLAERYAQTLPVKVSIPQFEVPVLDEMMQWHASRDRDPGLRWIRELLLRCAEPG